MLAFSVSGMANTIELDVIDPTDKNQKKLDCLGIFHDTFFIWFGRGTGHDFARQQADKAKEDCEKFNKDKNLEISPE